MRRRREERGKGGQQPERLEERRVMAFDLVSAFSSRSDEPFFVGGVTGSTATLDEAPQQITLRFSAGVKIDPATLGGITVVRSGGAGDPFGDADDVTIVPGSILVNDLPNQNEVVIRFAETLPDDSYRITIGGGASGLKAVGGDTMAAARTIDLRLDLGAFVVSVVPQPVTRSGSTLSQDRNTIVVHFNQEDPLAAASAQSAASYRLFEVDASGNDVSPLTAVNPTGVSYDAATGRAVLTFAAGVIADGKLYRLQVGAALPLVAAATAVAEGSDDNSSFTTALDLGSIGTAGAVVNGAIQTRATVTTPAGTLGFPAQPGTIDTPGHRDLPGYDRPTDIGDHGLENWFTDPAWSTSVVNYNFKDIYGKDGQGNDLYNTITETQKQRAREVFELFSRQTGIRFVETPSSGLTVVTGDVRALSPTITPGSVAGIGSPGTPLLPPMAIMNSLENWGSSEYGGRWFQVAMHEIGHALDLQHSYDIPSIMGQGLTGEPVFPGDYDKEHLAQLFPANGSDIDVYKFALAAKGRLTAETVIARPGQTATSRLDSVLTLYRVKDGRREMVARNDDSFGRDSFLGLDLEAGTYFIAVTSVGNDAFNPEVSDSGYGGQTAGAYQLKLGFQPASTAATTIADTSGTLLDGDRDGKPGGAFNFWFNTASTADTVFVDKTAANGGSGAIGSPYNTIKAAIDTIGSRKIIRIVGNATNTPYLVGTDLAGRALPDGATFEVPAGVTVMVDAGAVFKLRGANIDVGSSSPLVSRAGASLQVLGTPTSRVTFTSYHDDTIGGNSDNATRDPAGGQWGGLVLRKDSDAASKKAFVNTISQADIRFGGGVVTVDSKQDSFAPIQLESTRPTIAFNTISSSAGAAIAADPNSFEETAGRVGPELRGNRLTGNSTNGLFVKIRTEFGSPLDRLDVPARFKSTDIVYVIQENLVINGGVGGYSTDNLIQIERVGGITSGSRTITGLSQTSDLTVGMAVVGASIPEGALVTQILSGNSIEISIAATATKSNASLTFLRVGALTASSTTISGLLRTSDLAVGMAVVGPSIPEGALITRIIDNASVEISSAATATRSNAPLTFLRVFARQSGRLTIDPGVVVKLQGSRIEMERGTSQLVAEGTANQRVVFTSLGDSRFGAGGTFDTNGNLPDVRTAGDWGGIVLNAGAKASIDYAYIAFGGGVTPIEGRFDSFNVIETHQGDLRLAHSRLENNAAGLAVTNRSGRGDNAAATVFVRGAQPVILGNDFRDNLGATVSVNVNSLSDVERPDPGRTTGRIDRDGRYDDNRGPLVRDNRLSYTIDAAAGRPAGGATLGMEVRGEEVTVESVWDDVDVVHVLRNEVIVGNLHTATGVRLMSRPDASLIVKLLGEEAGFTASGELLDIDDRIGGTVQVVGQPGYPVVLTSLKDDTVGASLDPLGVPTKDTGADGLSTPAAGDWRSLKFLPTSNDRNVAVVQEREKAATGGVEANAGPTTAQVLGVLAPNFATGANTGSSAQEKSGDDNRRLGFEVHGRISSNDPTDVDVYSFEGYAGSEVWIDVDKTSPSLDSMIELLDAAGVVRARSTDSQIGGAAGPDFYSTNPKDPGLKVTLPGVKGDLTKYYVRVRSQPRYEPVATGAANGGVTATTQSDYTAILDDASKLKTGATSGGYQLRVRLRQLDEKPGSTVRYADIRHATIGIDVQGLPNQSPLTGDAGEATTANGTFATSQYVGNLLESNRQALSIAGKISAEDDVDWYTFALNYEQIQSIGGLSDALKTFSTIFDIDYADGFRGDLTLSVFDKDGKLIYVGRDSNVASDQPGAGQGGDFDDLSRGTLGKLDPYIGSVHMPAGNPTGSGSIETGGEITPSDPTKQLRYYVAVSSSERLPKALDAAFQAAATNAGIRLEPVTSIQRIVEDHIGFSGYTSGTGTDIVTVDPVKADGLIDVSDALTLAARVTPFTLSDVTLFVTTGGSLYTVDAMRGGVETFFGGNIGVADDIVMRADGRLYAYTGLPDTANTAGQLSVLNTGDGSRTLVGNDLIPDRPANTTVTEANLPATLVGGTGVLGSTVTMTLANTSLQVGTTVGTLQYSFTPGVGLLPVTGSWNFTTAANGAMTFTPAVTLPTGIAEPINGSVAAAGTVSVTFSQPVQAAGVLMATITYAFVPDPNSVTTDVVDALAWNWTTTGGGVSRLYYSVRDGGQSRLYLADGGTGSAATGRIGTHMNSGGIVTGMAFVNGTLYGVDTAGNFFRINTGNAATTLIANFSGVNFAGLAIGPQNLAGGPSNTPGYFSDKLFAIDSSGELRAMDTAGNLLTVFDADGNGSAEATSISTGAFGARGLAFSPLDVNLWHPTTRRGTDAGHGIPVAPDNSRDGKATQVVNGREQTEKDGGVSMYFGISEYVGAGVTPYLNYDAGRGQYGAQTSRWQQDLTSNAEIGNNYNLPGGAYGSLTTDTFSLSGYDYTDKPTLYFNYWLQTQNASSPYNRSFMRDSARVFVSIDGGVSWEVVATNNSERSLRDTSDGELPAFASASSRIVDPEDIDNQHVQELYDSAAWRQARIDLGKYAGQGDVRLRFDFSTAGMFDPTQRNAAGDLINDIRNAEGDPSYANTTGNFGSIERGQQNTFEGFYIDDIIVGFAERGEMVTSAVADQTDFFDLATPEGGAVSGQSLAGEYQLEIRGGAEYAQLLSLRKKDTKIDPLSVVDTNADQAGDPNRLREQGQFMIEANTITNALTYGISIDAGERDSLTDAPAAGAVRNLAVLNNGRLVPGVVVTNNVVSGFGVAGILFSGDANTGDGADASVPYGRIVNNTIYGGAPETVREVPVTFEKLTGTAALLTGVYRTDVGAGYKSITSITIRDSGSGIGGSGGKYSGFDLDAIKLSTLFTNDATKVEALSAAAQFDFTPTGTTLALGTQRPITSPNDIGPLAGTLNGQIDNAFATLDRFDGAPVGGNNSGIVSLGDNGAITFTFATPVVVTGPLYLYFGESGDNGEVAAGNILIKGVVKNAGVDVRDNAAPTLLNNLIANVDTGVAVDASSRLDDAGNQRTVIGTSAYYNVGTQVTTGVVQSQQVVLTGDPFVNAATGNFYLAAGSRAIDSSLNSLGDRPESIAVNSPLGIPESPIIAPAFDLYGQLRGDDPSQASLSGLGTNVFKDRGAIDRVDVLQPSLSLLTPQDQAASDADPAVDAIQLVKENARGVTKFVLQLGDNGVGIDKATVTSAAFTLKRGGTTLTEGTDYLFRYFENSNQVVFESAAFFPLGSYVLTATTRANVAGGAVGQLTDLANNTLLANQSNGTTSFAIVLADVPGVPTAVVGTSGEAQVSLSWTAPAASGAAEVTDYAIRFSTDGGASWTPFTDTVSTATSAVVTGLANNTAYVFQVAAINSVGQGEWSAASAAVTPQATPPQAPTGVAGVLGDGSVAVSWTAPSPGTSPITDYEIEFSSNGGSSWTPFNDGISTATSATVTPLANGTAYVFRVRAVNKNGPSPWSAASTAVTPLAPASAPLVTAVLAGDAQVTVSWNTPASNGSAITGYVIQSSSNGGGTWATTNVGVVNSSAVTGLVNGTAYVFRVAAVTGFGAGLFSTVTAPATPLGPSAAPAVTAVTAGDSQATVSWTTPATNGSPISGYSVEYSSDGGATWTPTSLGIVNTTVIAGLVNGTTYSFRVAAVTGFGTGLYSAPTALVTPLGPAFAPSIGIVTGGDAQVSLTWATPGGNGSAVTGYVLQRSIDGGATWTSSNLGPVTSTVVGGLVNGTTYVFRLAAVTAFGAGTFSTPTSPVTPLALPGTPIGLAVTGGDRSASLAWTAPAADGGRPITDYVVQYRDVASGTWLTLAHAASTATSAVVSGLTNGATYVFRVAAVTSFGQGGFTAESTAVTPLQLAGPPTRLTGRAADGTVSLIWTAPRATGGQRITDYVIDYSTDGGTSWTRAADTVSAATRATVAVPNGVGYIFRVAAVTAGGVGAFSINSTVVTPFARGATPAAPTGVVGVGGGGTINVSWVAPPANAGGAVRDYVVQYRLAGSSRWVTVRDRVEATAAATVNRLVPGRGYIFRIAARNLAGQGAFSAESAEIIA